MNAITKAISEIKFSIPREILDVAFVRYGGWTTAPLTLDERIENKVIRPKVLRDCDLVGGIEMVIDLGDLNPVYNDQFENVFKVPLERTDYKSIVSVLSVTVGMTTANAMGIGYGGSSDLMNAAWRSYDSMANSGIAQTARCELIGENTILVKSRSFLAGSMTARVVVANDPNLANITPRSYPAFAKLCILATKAYIYNTLYIPMEQTQLYAGHELGAFKDYVSKFEEAYEEYNEYLKTVWTKVAFMNDDEKHSRFIKQLVSPGV